MAVLYLFFFPFRDNLSSTVYINCIHLSHVVRDGLLDVSLSRTLSTPAFATVKMVVPKQKKCSNPGYAIRYSMVPILDNEERSVETVRYIRPDYQGLVLLKGFVHNEILEFELKVICGADYDRYTGTMSTGFGSETRSLMLNVYSDRHCEGRYIAYTASICMVMSFLQIAET